MVLSSYESFIIIVIECAWFSGRLWYFSQSGSFLKSVFHVVWSLCRKLFFIMNGSLMRNDISIKWFSIIPWLFMYVGSFFRRYITLSWFSAIIVLNISSYGSFSRIDIYPDWFSLSPRYWFSMDHCYQMMFIQRDSFLVFDIYCDWFITRLGFLNIPWFSWICCFYSHMDHSQGLIFYSAWFSGILWYSLPHGSFLYHEIFATLILYGFLIFACFGSFPWVDT